MIHHVLIMFDILQGGNYRIQLSNHTIGTDFAFINVVWKKAVDDGGNVYSEELITVAVESGQTLYLKECV